MNWRIWSWWHPTLPLYTHTHIHTYTQGDKRHTRLHLTVQQLPTWIRAGWVPVKRTHLIHRATASLFEWTATLVTIADPTSIDEPFPWWGLLFWEYTRHLLPDGQKNDHSTANNLTPPSFLVLYLHTPQLSLRSLHLFYLQGLWSSRCTSVVTAKTARVESSFTKSEHQPWPQDRRSSRLRTAHVFQP